MIRLAVLAIFLAAPAMAEDVKAAPGGVLRWLDKVTGETADIELADGQAAVSGRLTIQLDECRYPVDNPASNAYAHLTISDTDHSTPIFSGWMVAATPALSALDHPRYDVWPLHCVTPDVPVIEDVPEIDDEITAPAEG